jgi:hypothetical protein
MGSQPARVGCPAASGRSEGQASAEWNLGPAGASIRGRRSRISPPNRCCSCPSLPRRLRSPKGFETAEKLEFREQNYERAIEALRPLTAQPATRAEALLRIARLERRLNHPEAALAAYDRMSGKPRQPRWRALRAAGGGSALRVAGHAAEAAEQLRAALLEGRWPLQPRDFRVLLVRSESHPARGGRSPERCYGILVAASRGCTNSGNRRRGPARIPAAAKLSRTRRCWSGMRHPRGSRLCPRPPAGSAQA